jgi:hypothetical protein
MTAVTEEQWLAAADPVTMLRFLIPARISNRKARLLACAWVRGVWWDQLADERSRQAVEAGERYADRFLDRKGMRAKAGPAREVAHEMRRAGRAGPVLEAAEAACRVADGNSRDVALLTAQQTARRGERRLADLLRDLLGLVPFRPVLIDPAWLGWYGGSVVRVARAIYDGRKFEWMPVLADALEEAGCRDEDILGHCREQGGVHARGCWLLDLLLNRG